VPRLKLSVKEKLVAPSPVQKATFDGVVLAETLLLYVKVEAG
jgi:hypothetical protein